MALDLFVNFERHTNSSIFYRTIAPTYSVSIKLSDITTPDKDLVLDGINATIGFNNNTPVDFVPDSFGRFITNEIFNSVVPVISTINVQVSSNEFEFRNFQMSAAFVNSFPNADFIVFPKFVVNEQDATLTVLDNTNFFLTSGTYFYGEGHTELFTLSAFSNSGFLSNWFVGNQTTDKQNLQTSLLSTQEVTTTTSTVSVFSDIDTIVAYPIHLWLTNSVITTGGPNILHDDITGEIFFYPFFASTLNIINQPSSLNNILRDSIKILPYPELFPTIFISPFASTSLNLPFNFSYRSFSGGLIPPIRLTSSTMQLNSLSFLISEIVSTKWQLEANTFDDRSWSVTTPVLSNVFAYQFQLGYQDEAQAMTFLPAFKASSLIPTTINLTLTATKIAKITLNSLDSPEDWKLKQINFIEKETILITPLRFIKLFTPNYYSIIDTPVIVTLQSLLEEPYELISVRVSFENSNNILELSTVSLSGLITFNQLGISNANIELKIKNVISNFIDTINYTIPNFSETVEELDQIDPKFFRTQFSDSNLVYQEIPKISPNEWVVADNINSIITKIYNAADKLKNLSTLYDTNKNLFYGWIEPITTSSIEVWQNLESPCSNDSIWESFTCINPEEVNEFNLPLFQKTWQYHECDFPAGDPSCLQKYCIEWRWKSRKKQTSLIKTTWKNTQKENEFEKKWKFEKCEIDPDPINCNFGQWNISNIDLLQFPISNCTEGAQRCNVIDVVQTKGDKRIIAYPTEIQLYDNTYENNFIARRGIADELFSFQNISSICLNQEERIFVLDKQIPRVTVFEINKENNTFNLISNWGQFGLKQNINGFNKPNDLEIDNNNNVWIADSGNKCVKKFTAQGKGLLILDDNEFESNPPKSIAIDNDNNIHVLVDTKIKVYDQQGIFLFEYKLQDNVLGTKIKSSFTKDAIYVTYNFGILKYFKTGTFAYSLLQDYFCQDNNFLQGFNSVSQDHNRNLHITLQDKILKVADLMQLTQIGSTISDALYWQLGDLLIDKEEYIQSWVYSKSFHRLWDNIELIRNSLIYENDPQSCKSYTIPVFDKKDLILGQNEIVTNSVVNRFSEQLWANLTSIFQYFDPRCEGKIKFKKFPIEIIEETQTAFIFNDIEQTQTETPFETFTEIETSTETGTETETQTEEIVVSNVNAVGRNNVGQTGLAYNLNTNTFAPLPSGIWLEAFTKGSSSFLLSGQDLYASGYNFNGELGTGDTISRNLFVKLSGEWDKVSCGYSHNFALSATQWLVTGRNIFGQLGLGDTINRNIFTPISGNWDEIDCGRSHSVALSGTKLFTVGKNIEGQLGLGDNINRTTYTQVPGDWSKAVCGGEYTFALSATDLYVTGTNIYGALGLHTITQVNSFTKLEGEWNDIVSGGDHVFALSGEQWYAAGFNAYGQLGLSNTNNKDVFTAIPNPPSSLLQSWVKFVCGENHTFGLFSNTWSAAGRNNFGQLGLGNNVNQSSFTPLTEEWSEIVCGSNHTFAIE